MSAEPLPKNGQLLNRLLDEVQAAIKKAENWAQRQFLIAVDFA